MIQNHRKYAWLGIICDGLYFISVTLFLMTQTDWALTLWETMTVAGAFVMMLVLTAFAEACQIRTQCRRLMQASLSGTLFLTSAAHITSIGVIRKLISQGVSIPDYFRIGFYPSIEMSIDYTAWGLFMGCAFLFFCLGIRDNVFRIISLVCCILCLTGFIGSFISESLWYPAPLGYGVGFLILCIYALKRKQFSDAPQERTP